MVGIAGALTAVGTLVMALLRMSGLVEGTDWYPWVGVAILAGTALAAIGHGLKLPAGFIGALHALGALWLTLTVVTPQTMAGGVIPTGATAADATEELGYGLELLRFGAAPVLAVPGLVAIIAVVVWALSAWTAAALLSRNLAWAIGPNLVFYLQLATIDRRPSTGWWTVALAVATAGLVTAIGDRRSRRIGRLGRLDGSTKPRRSLGLTVASLLVVAIVGAGMPAAIGERVPDGGTIRWRAATGLGGLYGGGTALNPFVGLRQSVVSLSDEPVFFATLSQSAPPASELYWNLITLDFFDGTNWHPTAVPTYERGQRWEEPGQKFFGPTVRVSSRVRIAGLKGSILPALYSPSALESPVERIQEGFLVRADGTIRLDLSLRPDWEYEFQADIPQPDIAAMASSNGNLTPIFAEAARRDATGLEPADRRLPVRSLTERERFVALPERTPNGILQLTRQITVAGSTPFERGLLLEQFFRDSDRFTYSADVSTGHSALDLEDWLTDPSSTNYRTGYCEQFATAMAVMARTVNIPSRVVLGFTPGTLTTQPDGTEVVVVRERNAHAWVELWIDTQGWVRFDPTPRSDGINPSLVESEIDFDPSAFVPTPATGVQNPNQPTLPDRFNLPEEDLRNLNPGSSEAFNPEFRLPGWTWWVPALAALILAYPAARWLARRRRLKKIREGDVLAAWEEITVRLAGLGEEILAHQSPLELADRLGDDFRPLASMVTAAVSEGAIRGDRREAFARADGSVSTRGDRAQRIVSWMVPQRLRKR